MVLPTLGDKALTDYWVAAILGFPLFAAFALIPLYNRNTKNTCYSVGLSWLERTVNSREGNSMIIGRSHSLCLGLASYEVNIRPL